MTVTAPVLLHIGYHKTGTTFLQSGLFQSPVFAAPWPRGAARRQLVEPTDFQFDADEAASAFAEAEHVAATGLVPVISDERLSGTPHAGGHDSAALAKRLAKTFPNGKVLIVIREQVSAIAAMYRQYVRDGGIATLYGYLRPRGSYERPQFRFEHYKYHHLIGLYHKLFGQDRVLVLAYEDLATDSRAFCRRILDFVGADESTEIPEGKRYPSLSPLTLAIKRPFNRVFVRNALSPAASYYVKNHEQRFETFDRLLPKFLSKPFEGRIVSEVEELVGDRYKSSNAKTAALTGIDLAGLGYPVGVAGE